MKSELDGINYLNVSCDEIFDLVQWKDAKVLASLLILAFINVAVIVGNCLVILAVFISTKLRTVTNLFIVNLAVSDLLVGITVLPFSATWEIFEVWIFGELWCSFWLALDVLCCTASILNLCAISLDRYVAVTRPVTYPSIMSSKRAKLLIASVWILSFLICFPPLVGWNDRKRTFSRQLVNATAIIANGGQLEPGSQVYPDNPDFMYHVEECTLTCELTNDKGYVLYSAIGSFFLPMFVMLFFYWRIYRAAVETTRAINQGFRTTKGSRLLGTRFEEQRLTLRIHRGRSVQNHRCPSSPNPISPNGRLHHSSSTRIPRSRSHERLKVHLTPPPRDPSRSREKVLNLPSYASKPINYSYAMSSAPETRKRSSSYKPRNTYSANFSPNGHRAGCSQGSLPIGVGSGSPRRTADNKLNLPGGQLDGHRRLMRNSDSESSTPSPSPTLCVTKYETLSSSSAEDAKPKLISKMGKRNIKAQVKRFRMETKAAKTLGIIVGGFIGCWCPFFTIYVIRAFCSTCIPPLLFSVLFWLGYCNSAINPCIYALFSKDFRFAFKKIICRCVCQREKKPPPQIVPIFLSSLGEDSEGNNEHGSDSR